MAKGDLASVWRDYRLRFETGESKAECEDWPWPLWDGESLEGKRIALWTEQGIGDQILICRYIPMFTAEADKILLICNERLESLFKRSFPALEISTRERAIDTVNGPGPFDFHSAVIDVCSTRFVPPGNIPPAPLLKADSALVGSLRQKYKNLSDGRPLVGIAWRSGGSHYAHFKSTDLKEWTPILSNQDVAFVSLQYGKVGEEIKAVEDKFGIQIITDKDVNPFGDLDPVAAQVAAMDLIITTSNTTAHIAGSLGKPIWNMTPSGPGRLWYWFSEGSETPWYPGMKLFRHKYNEGWVRVLEEVGEQLTAFVPQLDNSTFDRQLQ